MDIYQQKTQRLQGQAIRQQKRKLTTFERSEARRINARDREVLLLCRAGRFAEAERLRSSR